MLPSNVVTILILASSMVSADPDEHSGSGGHRDRDGHTDYTFVIDDLVWLTFIVLMIVLLAWVCCTVYPEPQPMQPPCRPCHSTCDPVIHVKIDDPCKSQCWKKHKSALTPIRSFDEGDPTAPVYQESSCD